MDKNKKLTWKGTIEDLSVKLSMREIVEKYNILERKIKCEDNFEIFEYEDLIKLLERTEENIK